MSSARSALPKRVLLPLALLALLSGVLPATADAVAPSTAPTLTSPSDGDTVTGNPVLAWTAVTGAAKYRVQVSTSPSFSSFAYNVDTVNVKATPPTDLPLGALYWRVAATDGGSGIGPFADGSFTKAWGDAPNPTFPPDTGTLSFPTEPVRFTWDALPGAKTYTIEIDDADDYIGASSFTTNNTTYTLTEPQTVGQTFHWHVRGNAASGGIVSAWSPDQTYTYAWPATPHLLTPVDDDNVTDLVFSWDPVGGASTYQLQVSPNGDWANNVTLDVSVKGTRYSPANTILNGSYYWRVRAKDARSTPNNGAWSTEQTFTREWLPRPQELEPAWDSSDPTTIPTVGVETLSWTPVDHASYYELWIGTDVNFSASTFDTCFTNRTTVTPYSGGSGPGGCSMPIDDGTVYYWRVRGIDGGAPVTGLWSAQDAAHTYRFIYQTDETTLQSPADNATVETPVLSWAAVPNVEKYFVTIKKSGGSTATTAATYATSFTPTTLTAADGPFSWYVQTIDGTGNTSSIPASSDWFHFSLTAPTTDTSLAILAPANGASSVRMPSIQWQPYTNASYYKVWYGPQGGLYSATPLSGSSKLKFAAFTSTAAPLTAGTYKYFVEAFDASDNSLATSAERTFVISAPATLGTDDYLAPDRCVNPATCDTIADTPTLSWQAVPGAGAYEVTVANDANFTNQVVTFKTIFTTLTPRFSFLDSQANKAFYWFVRPCVTYALTNCGPDEGTSANQNASAFRKRSADVDLVAPADGATVADLVTFSWDDYLATNQDLAPAVDQEAKSYKIQVSTVADFSSVLDTATVDQTTYTPFSKTYPEGPLYWRVQAIDQTGNTLTVSDTRTLTKSSPAPAQTFPGDGDTVSGVPYLAWDPLDYAARYTVEVYSGNDGLWSPGNRVLNQTTKFSAWAPTTSLAGGTYSWRVRRLDADGLVGAWSGGRSFQLQAAAPTLISPLDGAGFQSKALFFSWGSVTGAAQYKFEASTTAAFTTIASSQTTVMASWAPTTAFGDGTWYWRVKAIDAGANTLSTSEVRSFTVDAAAPTVVSKTPTANASITGSFSVTFSELVHAVDATTFKMVIAGTATAIPGVVTPGGGGPTTTASFKPSAPLVPGQSYTLSLTAGIQDTAGNPLTATSWTVRTSLTVEQSSVAVVAIWDRDSSASASGGAYSAGRVGSASASFAFTGTDVTLVGRKANDGGKADIYLDGVKQGTIDFYRSATQWKVPMWSKTGLADAAHTLKLVVLGSKQSASRGTWVYLDAFTVGGTTVEETSASVKQAFRRVSTTKAYGSSYDTVDHVASGDTGGKPTYRLVFRGSDVKVYGTKTKKSGKATVYIDGVKKGTINLYASSTKYKVLVFDSPALTNAIHTLEIRLTGTKSKASKGTSVAIDRFVLK